MLLLILAADMIVGIVIIRDRLACSDRWRWETPGVTLMLVDDLSCGPTL